MSGEFRSKPIRFLRDRNHILAQRRPEEGQPTLISRRKTVAGLLALAAVGLPAGKRLISYDQTPPLSGEFVGYAEIPIFTLAELAAIIHQTTFATSSGVERHRLIERLQHDLARAVSTEKAQTVASAYYKNLTGRPLTHNLDSENLHTTLPDNRIDPQPEEHKQLLTDLVHTAASMPEKLLHMSNGTNVEYDDPTIKTHHPYSKVGTAPRAGSATRESRILGINSSNTAHFPYWIHEYTHLAQSIDPSIVSGEGFDALHLLRQPRFGSTNDMLVSLVNLYEAGQIDEATVTLANKLIKNGDIGDPAYEAAAYTIQTTLESGFLPPSDESLLAHLLREQLQAVADLSRISGVDIAALFTFWRRFGTEMHPALLTQFDQQGLLQHISPQEGGVLSLYQPLDTTQLSPGVMLMDTGTPEQPHLLALTPTYNSPGNINNEFFFTVLLPHSDEISRVVQAADTIPLSTPTEISGREVPGQIINILQTIAPGLGPEAYRVEFRGEHERKPDNSASLSHGYTVRLNMDEFSHSYDRQRVAGIIGEEGSLQAA